MQALSNFEVITHIGVYSGQAIMVIVIVMAKYTEGLVLCSEVELVDIGHGILW
jgi:hypothetical protein